MLYVGIAAYVDVFDYSTHRGAIFIEIYTNGPDKIKF